MKITPKSRSAWRDWLDRNHYVCREVWLVFYKRHTGKAALSYDDAVEEALCFGWIDSVRRKIDEARYMQRFSPRTTASCWSAANRERAQRMQKAGLMTAAGEKAVRLAKQSGKWETIAQTADLSVPHELTEYLHREAKAAQFFESLAPSYKRQVIAWITSAKRPVTRQRRLAEVMSLLVRGEKLGMR